MARSAARQLERLRSEFDSSFARPWSADRSEEGHILCFVADGLRYAAPLATLQQVVRGGPVVPLPAQNTALLGLAVVQASIMPVFSLALLRGTAPAAAPPAWLAVLRGMHPVALALESLAGYADGASADLAPESSPAEHTSGWVKHNSELYAVLDCAALYQAITQQH